MSGVVRERKAEQEVGAPAHFGCRWIALSLAWTLGLASQAPAALTHRFEAAASGQTDVLWANAIDTPNFALVNAILDTNIASPNTLLSAGYRISGPGTGRGGALLPHPFNNAGNTTFEFWIRPGALGADHQCLFETGGGQNGTSIHITESQVRVLNSTGNVRYHDLTVPLAGIALTDFIQIVVVLERAADRITLTVNGAAGGSQTAVSSQETVTVAGSNGSSLFSWGSGTGNLGGGVNALGGRTDSGAAGVTPAGLTQFLGDVALINVYDTALSGTEIQAAFEAVAVKEPTIHEFTVSPTNLAPGEPARLSWRVSPFSSVSLDPGIGIVDAFTTNGMGVLVVPVTETTVFTLTAANGPSLRTARAQVLVSGQAFPLEIGEFMADNEDTLLDGDGVASDWIEIHNPNLFALALDGYFLTDDPQRLTRWMFPSNTTLAGDGYLVVFASAKTETNYADAGGFLHTTFALDNGGEYLALVAPDGVTIIQEFAPAYPPQPEDVSFSRHGYHPIPTPGAPNDSLTVAGFVADTRFSVDRGFYTEPFAVEISCATPDAAIYYTLDGSAPTPANGRPYSAPIAVTNSTVLRAAAFKAGFQPSNVDTHTYLFLAEVLRQPNNPAGYPAVWGGHPADYEMDPEIVNHPDYRDQMQEALTVFPTLSLAIERDDLFGSMGLYQNPQSDGGAWERPVSAELIFPNGEESGFQIDAGLRIQGGSSRNPDIPKHSFSLRFRREYGAAKLRYRLFADQPDGEGAVADFDFLELRAGFNHSWHHRHYYQCRIAQYNRDQWMNDLFLAMGQPGSHGRWVHLYLNGIYWGIYHVHERPDADFLAAYFGGEPEEYDALNSGTPTTGDTVAWDSMYDIARTNIADSAGYASLGQWLDIDNLIDYMLLNFYAGNRDWDGHNWRGGRRRQPGAQYRFFPWDSEFIIAPNGTGVLSNPADLPAALDIDRTGLNSANKPSGLHQLLAASAEYRLRFADRAHRHLFNDGVLTPAGATRIWRTRSDLVDIAIVAESARWGDYKRDVDPDQWAPSDYARYTKNDHYLPVQGFILTNYIPARPAVLLGQLRARNLYPATDAPEFLLEGVRQHGGVAEYGAHLSFEASIGEVYFTTDGSDPRAEGGAVQGTLASRPITLTATMTVKARALNSNEWSALTEATFLVGTLAASNNLVISEVYYNPPGTNEATEFLELMNIETASYIDLTGARFAAGIEFEFPDATRLAPGERTLLVRDAAASEAAFGPGLPVLGTFANGTGLNNDGERITLLAHDGAVIRDFRYGDRLPWPPAANGNGFSLVLVNPLTNPDHADPANWRASVLPGGTPGGSDATSLAGDPLADDNANGVPDLLDHAMGEGSGQLLLPANPVQTLFIDGANNTYFTFTHRRNLAADDVMLVPEWSPDLAQWLAGSTGLAPLITLHNGDGTETITYRSVQPVLAYPRFYFRLRAEMRR